MLTQQVTICGYCEEPLNLDETSHYCDEREWFEEALSIPSHKPFTYSTLSLAEADAFLKEHPEFKEPKVNALTAHRKIGAYSTVEQDDFITPVNYDLDTLPVTPDYYEELTREQEWDGIYNNRDQYQREHLGYWKDVEPSRCTSVLYWWSNKTDAPGYPTPYAKGHVPQIMVRKQLTLFSLDESYTQQYHEFDYERQHSTIEGSVLSRLSFTELQGFASEQLYDFGITERNGFRYFNIYVGNDHHLHCGLLTINIPKGTVKCSRGDCYYRNHPLAIPDSSDRSVQESFTHAIIRHGNNHGPDFYRRREDFAFIHAENCDSNHERFTEPCNANAPRTSRDLKTIAGSIDFLIAHRKFCRDSNCRCGAYYHTLCHYERELTAA